ncbi:MAG: nitrous oxide reductase accessory protein NosL [Ramlibacter sp.]
MKPSHSPLLRRSAAAFALAFAFGGPAILAGCGRSEAAAVQPVEIDRTIADSVDGMILLDYPGPKGQIHYDSGKPDFFCDTVGMFSMYLQPEQQKRVRALFVQDMGQADWKNPTGHWIDAKAAYYVAGSKARGAMGPTLASFAREADAVAFAARDGGKVYRFDQVTPGMVVLDGGVIKDHKS